MGGDPNIIDRRAEWAERRQKHIGELRRRAAEAAAKLKRLYAAIEDGLADSGDGALKDRIRELADIRDTAEAEADRAVAAAERLGLVINPEILVRFAAATREMLATRTARCPATCCARSLNGSRSPRRPAPT